MKTHNLTQDNDRNDLIDCRIKGFSLWYFEDDRQHSRGEFPLFFQRNLIFNHSLESEMSLEEEESEIFKDDGF